MASQQQVLAVQQEINDVRGEISEVKTSLAEEKKAGHKKELDLLWGRLEKLDTQLVSLREEKNLLLRAQQNDAAGSALVDARGSIQNLLKPLDSWPSPEDFLQYLVRPDGRKIPVSQRAFAKAQYSEILVVDNTVCLAEPNAFIKVDPDVGGEEKTTTMMARCIPMVMQEMIQELAVPPTSEYYLDLSYSGNKTEDRSQNPSGVLRKLDRPDMLIMVNGATSFVGEDKGQGNDRQAVTELEGYVKGGLDSLHYASIKYLPCYAAAGSRVTLGLFNNIGKVTWMQHVFDMSHAAHRALFVFAVVNLLRWFMLMAKGLPEMRFRIQLLETWRRSSHVTITFQPGGRVRKQIRQFEIWAQEHSPGSSLDFLQKVYQVAQASQCLAHALEAPACVGRAQQYQVTLEAYGPPGNPMTMQEVQGYCQDCCAGAEALHAALVVMRDFRSPNVLTRNGAEGKYVIVDLEFAGPNKHPWTLDWLQGWDDHTLNQEGQYDTFSDMYQIGKLIEGLPFWRSNVRPPALMSFVNGLKSKQLSASEALHHIWITGHC
ncbi:hypothetical protein ABBQ38_012518 [Trebouxia sp. C0009 RCD-2024]